MFPVVSQSEEARKLIEESALQQIVLPIDGSRTLRSLAISNRQSILNFTVVLLPLFRAGFITLAQQAKVKVSREIEPEVAVTGQLNDGNTFRSGSIGTSNNETPLVACIDDSILIFQSLEKILIDNNYRCYEIGRAHV